MSETTRTCCLIPGQRTAAVDERQKETPHERRSHADAPRARFII